MPAKGTTRLPRVSRICPSCHRSFTVEGHKVAYGWGKYCSVDCKNRAQVKRITVPCDACGTPITGKPSRFRRNAHSFCNEKCAARWRTTHVSSIRFWKSIQANQRAAYGHACVVCGWDRCVEYAHIIPAAKGGTVHIDNIVVLCPNHHVLFDRHELDADEYDIVLPAIIRAFDSPNSCRASSDPKP
jgi:hypothetical protein